MGTAIFEAPNIHINLPRALAANGCGFAARYEEAPSGLQNEAIAYTSGRARKGLDTFFVDLGAGSARASVHLVQAGATVYAIDREDRFCEAANQLCKNGRIRASIKPVDKVVSTELPALNGVLSERFLHWINYKQADKIIKLVSLKMNSGGKAFISVAGFHCKH